MRRAHFVCEDDWYSCPKADGGCAREPAGGECTCGADEHNAALDALDRLRAAMRKAIEILNASFDCNKRTVNNSARDARLLLEDALR